MTFKSKKFQYLMLCAALVGGVLNARGNAKQIDGRKMAFAQLASKNLLKPQFCAPPLANGESPFTSTAYNSAGEVCTTKFCDHILYHCKTSANEPIEYIVEGLPESDTDCDDQPLRYVAMIIGGVGVQIRYNANVCVDGKVSSKPSSVLVAFSGGGGNAFRDTKTNDGNFGKVVGRDPDQDKDKDDNDYRALEMNGIRVVSPKWEDGVESDVIVNRFIELESQSGFSSRVLNRPHTWQMIFKRPASVVQFAVDYLTPKEAKFAVAGTSGGSIESASVFHHPISKHIDYLGLHGGGGGYADMNKQCGGIKTAERVSWLTGRICTQGVNCIPPTSGAVAPFPERVVFDNVLMTDDCLKRKVSEGNANSSLLNLEKLATRPTIVDFINNGPTDHLLGVIWPMGKISDYLSKKGLQTSWKISKGKHGQCMESGNESFKDFKAQLYPALGIDTSK